MDTSQFFFKVRLQKRLTLRVCVCVCCCPGLNKHVTGLWSCVSGLNSTVIAHGGILDDIQNEQLDGIHGDIKDLNASVNHVLDAFQSLSEQDLTGG